MLLSAADRLDNISLRSSCRVVKIAFIDIDIPEVKQFIEMMNKMSSQLTVPETHVLSKEEHINGLERADFSL